MSVKLIFPPQWIPMSPPVSTAMLSAHLRRAGVETEQIDLNLQAYRDLLNVRYLSHCHRIVKERIRTRNFNPLFDRPADEYGLAERYIPYILNQVTDSLRYVTEKAGLDDLAAFMAHYEVLMLALRLVSLSRNSESITFTDYASALSANRIADILQAIAQPERNLFYTAISECADRVTAGRPRLVGISIISSSQLIPGLILASQIKQRVPDIHVVLGGAALTYMSQTLRSEGADLFDHFDSIILYDGEHALLELYHAAGSGIGLDQVPNLMRRQGGRVVTSEKVVTTGVRGLPVPNYDGIQFADYLSRELVLSMVGFAKGCYWSKCTFCFETLWQGGFVPRDVREIAHEMKELGDRHGVRFFDLVDLAVPPVLLQRLGKHLAEVGHQVYWSAYSKSENRFPEDCFEDAFRGGCRQMLIGMESGNDRVLAAMQKGATRAAMLLYLEKSSDAGVWNHGFLMFGFPTETRQEAMETFEYVRTLRDRGYLHSTSSSEFALCVKTPIFENPSQFGLYDVRIASGDIGFECSYNSHVGLQPHEAVALQRQFTEEFPFRVDLPTILTLLARHDSATLSKEISRR